MSEFTDEQIEQAAQAIWERYAGHGPWETLSPDRQSPFRKDARAALTAAGITPQEPTRCVECGEVEVLGKPEHRVLCMDCAYEVGLAAGRRQPAPTPEREKLIAEVGVSVYERARRVIEGAMREAWSDSAEYEEVPEVAATRLVEAFPALASPLIDEGKLAEVIEEERRGWQRRGSGKSSDLAHAVAVHLKEGK